MTIDIEEIRATAERYLAHYPDERDRLSRLLAALDAGGAVTSRKTFTGHVTCGVVVLDPQWRALHIRHNALRRWLLPGGHVEAEDATLRDAAMREVREETGISPAPLLPLDGYESMPIDIDVHPIPANPAKDEPDHWHFDLRFAFTVADLAAVKLQGEEVSGFDWLTLDSIPAIQLREKLLKITTGW